MILEKLNKLFFSRDLAKSHFQALDGLRGIAVLIVLLSHSSNANLFFHRMLNFQKIGKVGVYLFFVLSAYLLDRQIAIVFKSGNSSVLYWKNYVLRRFLRIFPLFIIALILYWCSTLLGIRTVIDKFSDIPAHILLNKGEGLFWSIPVEFKYYILSPFLMWFCHRVLKWNSSKIFLCFMFLIASSILIEHHYKLKIISTFRYLPIFLTGTMISIFELTEEKRNTKFQKSSYSTILGLSAGLLIVVTFPFYFQKILGFRINNHSSLLYFPYAIL